MSFRDTQNPGIGGLDELTLAEETAVQLIAGLGSPNQVLRTNGAGNALEWATVAGTGDMVLADVQTVTGAKTFGTIGGAVGKFILAGSTSGSTILNAAAVAGTTTITLPGITGTVALGTGTLNEIPYWVDANTLGTLAVATYPSLTELSYVKGVTSALQTQLNGKAATLSGTINEIAYFNSASTIASLAVATYPSLTELSYVKGVTSGIQSQINAKGVGDMTLAGIQSVTGAKTFDTTKLLVKGSSTGVTDFASANAGASNYTITLPASSGTMAFGTGSANEIAYWSGTNTLATLAVATYPSLTELSYVKGVSSAIQTQIGTKAPSDSPTFTGTVILPKTIEIQDTTGDHQYVLAVSELTADRTVTLPLLTGSDEFVFKDHTQTLTNKTIGAGALTLAENASIALDPAGSADGKYSGITITGTAGATLAFGDLIYLDPTDSRWELADANAAAAADGDSRGILGICVLAAAADGNATTILLNGVVRADTAFPALTINAPVYVSETAGDIVVTQPTTADVVIRVVGWALTADEIYFNPSPDYITHT